MKPSKQTQAVWAGEEEPSWQGATQVPIVRSAGFTYARLDEWLAVAKGTRAGHIYSRNTNPTVAALEEKVRVLESAEAATSLSSGMAAISATFFGLLCSGDRVVSIKDSYGGTNKLFTEFLPRFQIDVTLCDTDDFEQQKQSILKGCRLLHLETPTNPTLKLVDIKSLAEVAHSVGAVVAVDNTFASPINQNPLELGADLVIHSATKFLGGHGDALGGIVCGRRDLVDSIYHYREINGANLDPEAAYLLLRGMKTLHLRIQQQNRSAFEIAEFLTDHSAVEAVHYPGLPEHPQHRLAKQQMRGFGGVLSFSVPGGFQAACQVLERLRFAQRAANLGSVETIAGPPATTSHVECSPEERAAMGIPEGLIRYSVGIEATEDLVADLNQALGR